jgi:hypothetical protein
MARRLRLANSGPFVRRADGSAPIAGDVVTALADGSPVFAPGSIERLPTQMAFTEVYRQDWLPVTQSGVVNPEYQTNRLQPTELLWVNDPFTDTNPARFTQETEANLCTLGLPGSTATLTATAGVNRMSLIRESTPLEMPHTFISIRVVSRSAGANAYAAVLLGVMLDADNYIVINWNLIDGSLTLQTKIGGVINFDAATNLPIAGVPLTLGLSIVGNWATMYYLPESGGTAGLWQKLGGFDLTPRIDFKAEDFSQWWGAFGFATPGTNTTILTVDDFKVGRFGGVGIRDICVVTHPDGSPFFVNDTTVAVTATLAGASGGIAEASQAGFVIDLEKKTFTQTSVIMIQRGGRIQNDHAAMLIEEDNGDQKYLVSSWGDTPSPVQVLYRALSGTDLMVGSHVITATTLALPLVATDYYDPFMIRKDGLYYLAYTVSSGVNAFFPALASSPDISTWTLIGSDPTAVRYEGTRILPFRGESYVLTGGQFNMRMYDLGMNYIGIVNCISPGDGTTQPHAMIFPYGNLDTLITFDQTRWPTSGGLAFSWGSIHWYGSPRY